MFDPREVEASGALGPAGRRVYPVALGRESGSATLQLTQLPNMSSLLAPNLEVLSRFRKKGTDTRSVGSMELRIEALDAIAARDAFEPDVLKLDTQGSELEILSGALRALKNSLLFVEVEVSFLERYQGQPLFHDIHSFMADHGFELIDLSRLKRYRAANRMGIGNIGLGGGNRPGRLAYADAFFLLNEGQLIERARASRGLALIKLVTTLIAYGKPDLAGRCYDLGHETLAEMPRALLAKVLSGFSASRFGLRRLHAVLDWIARHS
jgi:FkbM family methyltransferase